jgi:hypothetical protein
MRAHVPPLARAFYTPFAEGLPSIDKPARALPAMKLDALVERLGRANRDAKVGIVPLLGGVWV